MTEPAKKPPQTYLVLRSSDGEQHISIRDLAGLLGISEPVDQLAMGLERGNMQLFAAIDVREAEYPGITVDAFTPEARNIWLGRFELPCETYPTRIAARLYAGCERYETDEPIALVTHEVTDDARVIYRAGRLKNSGDHLHKIVYVDRDIAEPRHWSGCHEDDLPEHLEDEP